MDVRQNAARNWKYSKSYYQVTNHKTDIAKYALLIFLGTVLEK